MFELRLLRFEIFSSLETGFVKPETKTQFHFIAKGLFTQAIWVGDFPRRCYFKIENTAPSIDCFDACVKTTLRFVHARDVDIVSDTISIETLQYFQIATADDSDNM
jgi:hypothetical protein